MEKYTSPKLEIIKFNNEDILTTSGPGFENTGDIE